MRMLPAVFCSLVLASAAVAQEPDSTSSVPPPNLDPISEQPIDLLGDAITLQAVVDICDIELSESEMDELESAKHFFRGRAGFSRAQTESMRDRIEAGIQAQRRGFCVSEGRRDIQTRMKRLLSAAE